MSGKAAEATAAEKEETKEYCGKVSEEAQAEI